jgi:hypothetical protein
MPISAGKQALCQRNALTGRAQTGIAQLRNYRSIWSEFLSVLRHQRST